MVRRRLDDCYRNNHPNPYQRYLAQGETTMDEARIRSIVRSRMLGMNTDSIAKLIDQLDWSRKIETRGWGDLNKWTIQQLLWAYDELMTNLVLSSLYK